jgi:hypothetical protein
MSDRIVIMYNVLAANSAFRITELVNEAMKDGWEPSWHLVIGPTGILFQVMVKR